MTSLKQAANNNEIDVVYCFLLKETMIKSDFFAGFQKLIKISESTVKDEKILIKQVSAS